MDGPEWTCSVCFWLHVPASRRRVQDLDCRWRGRYSRVQNDALSIYGRGVKTNASQISLHAHTVLLELKKTQCSRVRNQLGETRRHHTWKLHGETHRAKTVNTHEALVLISEFKENHNSRQTMKHRKKGFVHKMADETGSWVSTQNKH